MSHPPYEIEIEIESDGHKLGAWPSTVPRADAARAPAVLLSMVRESMSLVSVPVQAITSR